MTFAPLNKLAADFNLADLLNLLKKEIFLYLNCHAIATIKSYDQDNQSVYAQINYGKTRYSQNPTTKKLEATVVDYPVLVDCPVLFIGVTYPINAGDQAFILFNDRDIDNWIAGARSGPVATNRLHSFSDGIALVGLNKATNYDPVRAVLGLLNGNAAVAVSSDKVKVFNQLTTLNTLLQDLVTEIKAITTSNAVIGVPCTISVTSQLNLTNIATQIGGLLE